LKELELIIIDEISMVRADIIDFIDKVLRVYSDNPREPFGGKQLLLVGDIFQLEPVVTGDMRDLLGRYYSHPYFFCAKAFDELNVVSVELRKIYRQNDDEFIAILDRIRLGRASTDDMKLLNSRIIPASHDDDGRMVMTLATKRDMVDSINDERLRHLKTPEITYQGTITGEFPENSLPTSMALTLKVGAQVVFIKNDIDRRWVNGTLGRIYMADEDTLMVELESGEKHVLDPAIWRNIKYEYDEKSHKVIEKELGSFVQYPVKLAWALTIHKSQGLTFNDVVIDIGRGTFSGGQAYVALSRCRSLGGLSLLSTINQRDVFVNPEIITFSRSFNDKKLIDSALERAKADDLYSQALDAIERDDAASAFELFISAMRLRNEIDNTVLMRFARMKLSRLSRYRSMVADLQQQVNDDKEKFEKLALEYVSMGDECRREGFDPTPALANYDKALSLCPDCVEAMWGNGRMYVEVGNDEEAIPWFKRVYELRPDEFDAPMSLGEIYMRAGNLSEAMNWFLIALSIDDEIAVVHERLADLYESIGEENAASHHNEMAKKLRKKFKGRKPKS
ncbi:tetratricopeptide repeat protein, partial [uncultured Muribaculum sp.]